jgi:hypothetical protein
MTATLAPPREPVAEELELFDDAEFLRLFEPAPELRAPSLLQAYYRELLRCLLWGWPAFLLFISLYEPSSTGVPHPTWVVAGSIAILVGLPILGFAGALYPSIGLSGATLVGALGIAIGISCRATAHHLGPWWIVETTGFALLTALSAACLAARVRR